MVLKGTTAEIAAYIGRTTNFINQCLSGNRYFIPGYYMIVYGTDSKHPPGCRYIKEFQIFALKEYGNTVIRDSHEKFKEAYIKEFKKFGLVVEIERTIDGNLIAYRKVSD